MADVKVPEHPEGNEKEDRKGGERKWSIKNENIF